MASARVNANMTITNRKKLISNFKKHLVKYWGLKDATQIEKATFVETQNLPARHKESYDFLNDDQLAKTMIGVVPDLMWVKGHQPSESSAEHDLILVKESYYNGADEIGWMVHELAHCLRFKEASDTYEKDSATFAFDDL